MLCMLQFQGPARVSALGLIVATIFCLINSQLCSRPSKICFSKETPVIRKRRDRLLCCFTDVVSIALLYGR